VSAVIPEAATEEGFAPAENAMVRDVLALADRPVQTIMTPRPEVACIDPGDPRETVLAEVRNSAHRQFLVSRGSVDDVVGSRSPSEARINGLGEGRSLYMTILSGG
jgi:putative hemolysin